MKYTKDFIQKIKQKETENYKIIKNVESLLNKQRGYVFKMPRKNKPVIMMISGGLDSVTTISWLIETYKLNIFPLFIDRGQGRVENEEKSVRFFEKYFLEKYPKNFNNVFKISTKVPPSEIRKELILNSGNKVKKTKNQREGIALFSSLLGSYAVQYAKYLEYNGIKVRTIFRATLASDSIYMAHESLTSLRTANLNICAQTNDFTWQFTSPLIEKELNYYLDKTDLLKWADKVDLPIEKTWSCYNNKKDHCGHCDGCCKRKESFQEVNIKDKTIYNDNSSLFKKIIKILK